MDFYGGTKEGIVVMLKLTACFRLQSSLKYYESDIFYNKDISSY